MGPIFGGGQGGSKLRPKYMVPFWGISPKKNRALFGLVSYNDPSKILGFCLVGDFFHRIQDYHGMKITIKLTTIWELHFFTSHRSSPCKSEKLCGTVWQRCMHSAVHDGQPGIPEGNQFYMSNHFPFYGWWLKSCTTWDVWNPINNGINYLSTGAGFQPSTVVLPGKQTAGTHKLLIC